MPSYASLCRFVAGFAFASSLGVAALSGGMVDNIGWILGGATSFVSQTPTVSGAVSPLRGTEVLRKEASARVSPAVPRGAFSLESLFASPSPPSEKRETDEKERYKKKEGGGEDFFSSSPKNGRPGAETVAPAPVSLVPPVVVGFFGAGGNEGVFASLSASAGAVSSGRLSSRRFAALRPGNSTADGWKYAGKRDGEAVFLSPDGTFETSVAPSSAAISVSVPSSSYDATPVPPEHGLPGVFDAMRGAAPK